MHPSTVYTVAGRGIDLSAVERTSHPTRDVLVERSMDGDRNFAGFGKAAANEYSDCFIDPAKLPEGILKVRCNIQDTRIA